jgi:hypothetical protein
MIYFATFVFTILLSHIARAMPACGDVASPEGLYDTYDDTYDDEQFLEQPVLDDTYKVTWDSTYDNPNGNTDSVACSNGPHGLAGTYPQFKDFPISPYIGGAFDVKWGSPNCGKCWKLYNKKTNKSISLIAIDAAGTGFNIAKEAFIKLGGNVGSGTLDAQAKQVPPSVCGFR